MGPYQAVPALRLQGSRFLRPLLAMRLVPLLALVLAATAVQAQPRTGAAPAHTLAVGAEALHLIRENEIRKGDVLTVSNVAGVLGARAPDDGAWAKLLTYLWPAMCKMKVRDDKYKAARAFAFSTTTASVDAARSAAFCGLSPVFRNGFGRCCTSPRACNRSSRVSVPSSQSLV